MLKRRRRHRPRHSSSSSSDGEEDSDVDQTSSSSASASTSSSASSLESESLGMLEWPSICRQVACLTQTPMGARAALFDDPVSERRGGGAGGARARALARRKNGQSRRRGIPLAATREEAERLLDETEAALEAISDSSAVPFDLSGALDLTQLLDSLSVPSEGGGGAAAAAAAAGAGGGSDGDRRSSVTALAVSGVADTLEAAAAAEGAAARSPALAALAAGRLCGEGLAQLLRGLRRAVPRGEARLADSATPQLAEARARRRGADAAARAAAAEWGKRLHAAGAAARAAVALRRDRLCVPVLTARKSELPRGSVTLATSASGATSFCEPAPLVPLNNEAAAARQGEEAAEAAALEALTGLIVARGRELRGVVEAVAALDVARARAEHARWVSGAWGGNGTGRGRSGVPRGGGRGSPAAAAATALSPPPPPSEHPCAAARPRLLDAPQGRAEGAVRIEGLLHPLLLERALPRLPNPPGVEEEEAGEQAGNRGPGGRAAGSGSAPPPSFPRGLAFRVPQGTSVVVITGPNTGGKTAGLKSLGLASLMARAGLFLAVEGGPGGEAPGGAAPGGGGGASSSASSSASSATSPSASSSASSPRSPPTLSFFDCVLADVGDPQSLAASLSTFSGHVRRAARALEAVRGGGGDSAPPSSEAPSSSPRPPPSPSASSALVLLDELGAGTDPSEGAALGAALLDAFAESRGAALTVATAHFAELKGDARPHVADAAVEFDPVALAPTYRLLWGSGPGNSCALEVARGLGFDLDVVEAAAASLGRGGEEEGEEDEESESGVSAAAPFAAASSSPSSSAKGGSGVSRTRADVLAAAAGLAATLAADLGAARDDAAAAAGERAAAEREAEAAALASAAAAAKEQEAAGARSRASSAAEEDVSWALGAFERGELSEAEAAGALAEVAASAPSPAEAAARLARARRGGGGGGAEEEGGSPSPPSPSGASSPAAAAAATAWLPAVGEEVAVLKMGGRLAVVTRAPRSPGSSLVVRLSKGLDVTLRTFEVAPPPRGGAGAAGGEGGAPSSSSSSSPSSPSNAASLRGAARSGSLSASGSRLFLAPRVARRSPDAPAIKTPDNTVDVRGLDSASAAAAVRDAVGSADDGDALFVVHGLGAGVLKKAVRAQLAEMVAKAARKKKNSIGGGVASYGDDEESQGGVTIIRVRR